jgi:hypothetical protein
MNADRSSFPKLLIPPLFSGFAAVMAEAPSEAAIQESQVVPSRCPPLPFPRPCLTVDIQATGMNYASEVQHV